MFLPNRIAFGSITRQPVVVAFLSRFRSLIAALFAADIRHITVIGAIGFAGNRRAAAELKIGSSWLTVRPTAHTRTKFPQANDLGLIRLFAYRRLAFGQSHAMGLADDGILRRAKLAADFTGGETFVPKTDEFCDLFFCPID